MPSTHTADFQTAALKATDLEAVEKINVGLETELARKQLNIIADAPEIRIQDKTGSASETTMSIVADGGATHFRAGIDTFAEGTETKGNVKFQSSTGATTHAEIVGSSGKLELQDGGLGLKRGSNVTASGTSSVIQEITGPHARDSAVLKKYPEVSLASNAQSGYTVTASNASDTRPVWQVFDGSNATLWGTNGGAYNSGNPGTVASSGSYPGEIITLADSTQHDRGHWMKIKFPHKVRLSSYHISAGSADRRPASISILGSNDDSNWYIVKDVHSVGSEDRYTIEISASTAYRYALLLVHSIVGSDNQMVIDTIEYYGYEEVGAGDDSVDTTVKSVYNTPDLTSAALYIDGKKSGSTPTDYGGSSITVTDNGTWDSSDNTWSLSGATTSNLVSADLGFVGDQPHSVSAWVKADRLNDSGLFHVGTAEGEGDAASRVGFVDDSHISWGGADHFFSNTEWHNVTYTYNGEGSDKKLYLDGRLVGTAKNEDTFGEYPPFAMSNYSQYGYVVSASSEYTSVPAYRAFDRNTDPDDPYRWTSADNKYNTNGSYSGSESHTDVDGNTEAGEWLKIEMPHRLEVSYFEIAPYPINGSQSWRNYAILGSNDNVNWYQVQKVSGLSAGNGLTAGSVVPTGTYKNYAFKYFVFIWSNKAADSNKHISMGELKIFGHRENDLVRFPDSVNVLKYPHITVDEPAKRGYAVSQSSQLLPSTGGSTGYYHGYNVFDREVNIVNRKAWISMNGGNSTPLLYDTNGDPTAAAADTVVDGTTTSGEWVQLKLPHKIKLSYLRLMPPSEGGTTLNRAPKDGVLAGSTDGTTWTAVSSWSGASYSDLQYNTFTANIDSTNSYDYLRLIVKKTGGATLTSIQELEFYGTEEDLDVIARVGDGFDGKVRNLRVYSTALSDARVQEIFDADKDEFGLAKSSVSVYRGHLGVGTDTPKAALTVMDEVAELEEFPPSAMTAEETYIEGHGVFNVSSNSDGSGPAWRIFDYNKDNHWTTTVGASAPGNPYSSTNGYYTDTSRLSTGLSNGVPIAPYILLQLPYRIKLSRYEWQNGNSTTYHVTAGIREVEIWAQNSGDTSWTLVSASSTKTSLRVFQKFSESVNSTMYYDKYAFIALRTSGNPNGTVGELRYFGTREQGASTLHNGELSLTRNLTVPRIGPPLDADDTPRRDRLVVEYNTSTNPTANGTVKDTSGRGNDGLFYGGASYDATEKALVFDGTDDYITTRLHNQPGDWIHSISFWVKFTNLTGVDTEAPFQIGPGTGAAVSKYSALDWSSAELNWYFFSNDLNTSYALGTGASKWIHFACVYEGGGATSSRHIYLDGINISSYYSNSPSNPLDFNSNQVLTLGRDSDRASTDPSYFHGKISNFKLYDVALTADEVKRLYDMGRCDEGHHVVNFSKTRVGIGLGDGEVSDALLNVGGVPYGRGAKPCFCASRRAGNVSSGNTIIFDHVEVNQQNGYNSTTGTFTAPVSGLYLFSFYGMSADTGNSFGIRAYKNGDTYEMFWPYTHHHAGSPHKHVSGTQIVPMNTGDTFLFKVQAATLYGGSNGHNSFVGYLIE